MLRLHFQAPIETFEELNFIGFRRLEAVIVVVAVVKGKVTAGKEGQVGFDNQTAAVIEEEVVGNFAGSIGYSLGTVAAFDDKPGLLLVFPQLDSMDKAEPMDSTEETVRTLLRVQLAEADKLVDQADYKDSKEAEAVLQLEIHTEGGSSAKNWSASERKEASPTCLEEVD